MGKHVTEVFTRLLRSRAEGVMCEGILHAPNVSPAIAQTSENLFQKEENPMHISLQKPLASTTTSPRGFSPTFLWVIPG